MTKKLSKPKLIILIFIILTIVFIFVQSMMNKTVSANESNFIKEEVVEPIYEAVTGKKEVDFDVRKLAHMIEFGVLGLEVTLFFNNDSVISRALKVVGFCFLVAFIDETIQIFSDRGSSILDVYIDLSGVLISFIIVSSILAIVNKVKEKKKIKESILN